MLTPILSFGVACLVTLAVTPAARRGALLTGFLDEPAERKSHTAPIPYLGGVAVALGATLGVLLLPAWDQGLVALGLGASVLFGVGLVDDRWTVHPLLRLSLQLGAGVLAMVGGVGIVLTGNAVIDGALTLLFIVGVTNAANLMDNMDGLAASVLGVAALGVAVLAGLGGQVIVAVVAAALGGALVGFLGHNARPATIFMGDGGSLPSGYVLAVVAIEVSPAITPPSSFVLPVLLLGLLLIDTTTVTIARLRHGRAVSQGGRDHLSHRLTRPGRSVGQAVARLTAAQMVFSALAIAVGRSLLPVWAGVALAVAAGGLLLAPALTTRVYDEHARVSVRRLVAVALTTFAFVGAPVIAYLALNPLATNTITLSTELTDTDDTVQVLAAGFAPGSVVELHLGGRQVARPSANGDGVAEATVAVPDGQTGRHAVVASGTAASGDPVEVHASLDATAPADRASTTGAALALVVLALTVAATTSLLRNRRAFKAA